MANETDAAHMADVKIVMVLHEKTYEHHWLVEYVPDGRLADCDRRIAAWVGECWRDAFIRQIG